MRKLTWAVVLAALIWSGWWVLASQGLRNGITAWLEARASEGWQAEVSMIDGGGYPLTLQANLAKLALADPRAGLAVFTDHLTLSAPAWWPGDVTVVLDEGPILFASPIGRKTMTMQGGVMELNLQPGSALQLERLGWTAGPWQLTSENGTEVKAQDLILTMTQTDGPTYELVARANQFAPGDVTRRALRLSEEVPETFESLQMQATITFDTTWDRRALDTRRPQPRQIILHLAEAHWGLLNLSLAADLAVNSRGVLDGTVSLRAQNWRALLDLAEASGTLPPSFRRQVESVLQTLAQASGNPGALDVKLNISDGVIALGFIPIAPAPRIILR